ncbi:MAG: hypothetical protein FD161_940 [Limisphaerales bacterium]|nr:MAG: hypothetical protein FD161_940 [Limisphaerales bacterium]KAG0509922.1 MAG: hypothetical protein E1N63_940 [Limisphaerales bacterium]TXT50607.1 MAG: hypothetical protein FD140_2239 [Limisphaerales bacterium]
MPYRRLPNTMSAVIRTLKAARDQWKLTPVPADRAITDAHWAQLDDAPASNSFLNRLLKEASDVDLALAAQAPLTTGLSQAGARLTMFVSHFHQVLDLGITRGTFAAGARSYYGRDVGADSIPDLSTQDLVAEAAERIVTGEAARATAEAAAHIPMSLPSAAEVAALRTAYLAVRGTQSQAVEKTDREREELAALYNQAYALAVDICESVEFFYRKDPDPGSFRTKCQRWGVVYIYEDGTVTAPSDGGNTLPPNG